MSRASPELETPPLAGTPSGRADRGGDRPGCSPHPAPGPARCWNARGAASRPATEPQTLRARNAVVAVSVPCAGPGACNVPRAALLCRMTGTWPDLVHRRTHPALPSPRLGGGRRQAHRREHRRIRLLPCPHDGTEPPVNGNGGTGTAVLARGLGKVYRRRSGRERPRPHGLRRRDLRLPRTQRRGQVHHPSDADHAAAPHRGPGATWRASTSATSPMRCAAASAWSSRIRPSTTDLTAARTSLPRHLYGLPRHEARADRALTMLDLMGLAERRTPIRSARSPAVCSRRLEIARGLLHSPSVLFLDEPTTGLTRRPGAAIWEHLAELRQERAHHRLPDHPLPRGGRALRPDRHHRRRPPGHRGNTGRLKAVVGADLVVCAPATTTRPHGPP